MGEIIKLAIAKQSKEVPPKSETFEHGGQRYTCRFDPNAPKHKQWVWTIAYVRTYHYVGSGPSLEHVSASARRKIHSLNRRVIEQEEADAAWKSEAKDDTGK